jgi:deoxycytidylate deaminase
MMRAIANAEGRRKALAFFAKASDAALKSTCVQRRCGSVIVKGGEVIGEGFNSPPADRESARRCLIEKGDYHERVTDKTCCVHAEQRAIIDALRRNPGKLEGSRLYFIDIENPKKGKNGDAIPKRAGRPYCTMCSKLALDVGIAEIALWHESGVYVYDTEEYNKISAEYRGD